MSFYIENETEYSFPFSVDEVVKMVMNDVLDTETCPYEAQINLVITDNDGIHEVNKEYRGIDRETDVLSFPNLEFDTPGDFAYAEAPEADCFDPDSGEMILGDIMISYERVLSQASDYGHSIKREFAFLVAHSMLHLCGYDHMEPEEAKIMEEKQEAVLTRLGITRD